MAESAAQSPSHSTIDLSAASADLTILIPAYNEEAGIKPTLETLIAEPALKNAKIFVVDDGSTDNTAEIAGAFERVRVLRHKNNQGYGAGIKTGTRHADTTYVAWFDADGQHRSEDLVSMFELAIREEYDAVIGERTSESAVVKSRVAGKYVLKQIARFVTGRKIHDINCGLRVFRRDLLENYLPLLPDGFSASTTSLLLFIKRNRHFCFAPVVVDARAGTSTVKQVRDGLKAIHLMTRILFLFSALKAFAIAASVFIALGLAYGIGWALYYQKGFPVLGALIVLIGVVLFCIGIVSDQISSLRIELMERGSDVRQGDWKTRVRSE